MYRVLVPVDTNEDRALTQAKFVASLPHAAEAVEAILLFVFHGEADELPDELKRFGTPQRIDSVRRASEYLEEHGIDVKTREDSGDTARDVIDLADSEDVDLIVLGGRKRSPAEKVLFGSISQSVLLGTDRPVVVTGGHRD
ncbi:universal stress protein [Haloarchaeobius baliensis]|uniref:universal stress protein n=1 Tax=Haloarchaeobius baliensis TaxID=1670458 RepID=UPI003F8804D0